MLCYRDDSKYFSKQKFQLTLTPGLGTFRYTIEERAGTSTKIFAKSN